MRIELAAGETSTGLMNAAEYNEFVADSAH
jgi:hypothetical protein